MKYYFVSILFLMNVSILADNNPFDIKEDFQAIDRADNSLFSTMQRELDKAKVVPESVMIDFKKSTMVKSEINSIVNPPKKKKYNAPLHKKNLHSKMQNSIEKEKKVKLLSKEKIMYLEQNKKIAVEKKIQEQAKRKRLRILNKQEKIQRYYEKQIANIDLVKEKRIKREKLNEAYHKAVKAVDTFK